MQKDVLHEIVEKLDSMGKDIHNMNIEQQRMKADLQEVKQEQQGMKTDLQMLKQEQQGMKADLHGMKKLVDEIPAIKQAVLETNEAVKRMKIVQQQQHRIIELLSSRSIEHESELKEIKRII